ncbi:MAG TPA: TonB-dependent receptor [Methylomirabilota bacterium]|nr:TonB-dependent receptor [Methylomirabilota bacterium]
MVRTWRLLIVMVLALGAPVAAAQELKHTEPVVVTATKVETPAEQLGAAVTVITGEEIETRRYPTVDEALRQVPGVEIRRSGSFGKTTSISIRGANPNQVQVLVDGVRVKSPTTGQAELADLSPELIERIEVIRGPQSTIYGADAMGGVVNIITRRGKGPFSAWASQEAGNYDTLRSAAGFAGSHGIFDYAFGAGHFESNGLGKNDGVNQDSFNTRLGLTLPGNTSLGLALRWNRTDSGTPIEFVAVPAPIVPTIDPNTRQESETLTISLAARTRPVSWWESELRVGRYWNKIAFIDPPDPFTCPPITFGPPCDFPGTFEVERREVEWLNHFHVATWSTSTFGIEYRHEHANVQGTNGFGPITETVSGLFQQQFRFFDRLFMAAGVRVEDNTVFGTSVTERGSLSFMIPETNTRLRGGAGSGFRAPTFNDLFFPGFSNPTLQPEESFSWDVGVDQKAWANRIRLGATYFHQRFTNLIACCVFLAVPPFVTTGNIGRARANGLEVTSEVDLLDTLVASVNYTYTETKNLVTGAWLPREPQHRWNARLAWQPIKPLSLWGEVHAVTRQFEALGAIYNTGHTRVDVGGAYRLFERWGHVKSVDLTARIQNLLNEHYAEVRGFPAPGITGIAGVRVAFE